MIYMVMRYLTSGFKSRDPKEFDLNKYNDNSSKGCVLEVDIENLKHLCELHDDYPLAPDKREILSKYQLMIADFFHTPTDNVKKLVPNTFDKEKMWKLTNLRLGFSLKKYIAY